MVHCKCSSVSFRHQQYCHCLCLMCGSLRGFVITVIHVCSRALVCVVCEIKTIMRNV